MVNLPIVGLLCLSLAFALLLGGIAVRLRQSPLLGYIFSGLIIGYFFNAEGLFSTFADIGVAFLLFTLGLGLSLSRLGRLKKVAFWGGLIEILAFLLFGILFFPFLGFDGYSSLFLAAGFSLSSTAVVYKVALSTGQLDSLPGQVAMGLLLVQDLAVLPMITILPLIGRLSSGESVNFLGTVGKSVLFLLFVLLILRKVVAIVVAKVAALNSKELVLVFSALCCLLMAMAGQYFLSSWALGAFIAGILISSSKEKLAITSEIKPLRDFFSILFFVSLGMSFGGDYILGHWPLILMLSLLTLVVKFVIIFSLLIFIGFHAKLATLVGLWLFQVGEFSFILARSGLNQGLITGDVYSLVLAVSLLTIAVTPLLISFSPQIYLFLYRFTKKNLPAFYKRFFVPSDKQFNFCRPVLAENHVVICGYGRVGQWLGRILDFLKVPFVVIDYDWSVVESLAEKNIQAIWGDPEDVDILDFAEVDKAKIVVLAIPDRFSQEEIVKNCRSLNPKINIISRVHSKEDLAGLRSLGVDKIIHPEFEAALVIGKKVLKAFRFAEDEITGKIKRVRMEHGME